MKTIMLVIICSCCCVTCFNVQALRDTYARDRSPVERLIKGEADRAVDRILEKADQVVSDGKEAAGTSGIR